MQLLCQTGKCGEYPLITDQRVCWSTKKNKNLCENQEKKMGVHPVSQRKSWKRRFFTLDDNAVSYYKSEMVMTIILSSCRYFVSNLTYFYSVFLSVSEVYASLFQDKEPLRSIPLRDIQKVHECLVKSG